MLWTWVRCGAHVGGLPSRTDRTPSANRPGGPEWGLGRSGLRLTRHYPGRSELADLPIRRHPDAALLRRAWELRDICTTYDGLYAALAEGLDAALITRDMRLARGLVDSPAVSCSVRVSDAP